MFAAALAASAEAVPGEGPPHRQHDGALRDLRQQLYNQPRTQNSVDLKGVDCKLYDKWTMLNGISTNHYTLDVNAQAIRMTITITDAVAWLAILVSGLAALYARWSAREAKRANKLALQARREEIYRSLLEFQDLFRAFRAHPTAEQVDEYHRKIVLPSRLYFSPKVAPQVESAWSDFWNFSRLVMALEGSGSESDKARIFEARTEFHDLGATIKPLLKEMEWELNVQDV